MIQHEEGSTLVAGALILRPATSADVAALGRLGALLVRVHHDFDPRRFFAPTPGTEQGYASWLASQLREPDVIVLVAEQDGAVIGYAYASIEGPDWMALRGPAGVVHDLVIAPEHRRHGIGLRLLDATIQMLRARGAPSAVLSTAWRNVEARRLFERSGFRSTMIEMTRELDGGDV